ncbi:hypothetical protein AVEN_273346-1 [Araneus ventricosus]|uniref:Uncharacterized protein n=1 Tax=Araneus ventricosus TaxID=182803 RepID=A0A4Y2MFN0_ARAVE|nr:hypothetical protein AVEN_273346-1 [Araneus ventricosus]
MSTAYYLIGWPLLYSVKEWQRRDHLIRWMARISGMNSGSEYVNFAEPLMMTGGENYYIQGNRLHQRGSSGVMASLRFVAGGFHVRNPILLKIHHVWGLLPVKSHVGGQMSSRWYGAEVWSWVADQVSCSTSDRGSK